MKYEPNLEIAGAEGVEMLSTGVDEMVIVDRGRCLTNLDFDSKIYISCSPAASDQIGMLLDGHCQRAGRYPLETDHMVGSRADLLNCGHILCGS